MGTIKIKVDGVPVTVVVVGDLAGPLALVCRRSFWVAVVDTGRPEEIAEIARSAWRGTG